MSHTLTKAWDVVMDIPIVLDILIWFLGYLKNYWEVLLSEFSHSEIISACPRTIICNKCEQNIMREKILNASDNVDDKEKFGFTE